MSTIDPSRERELQSALEAKMAENRSIADSFRVEDGVTIVYDQDDQVRHVRLNAAHPAKVTPSWFGDSIGHYENGDTLVIDTVGLAAKPFSYLDAVRTPHSEKLHVVERFTIAPDKQSLTAIVRVEDPDTLNEPMTLKQVWRRSNAAIEESVCADDGGEDHFNQNLHPIPKADKPDF